MSRKILVFLSLVLSSVLCTAQTLTGKVVAIHDGDTLTLLDAGKRQHKIRLAQIDAPEKRQAFGERSRQSLSELAFGKEAQADCPTTDRYGRAVCTVFVGDTNLNLEQIKRGMAWVYRKYATDQVYFQAEAEARAAKKGLWADPNPIPPWEFRHRKSIHGARQASTLCGGKRTCREMASCEEAQHYLRDCGAKSLDRDKDGVPCESLCKQGRSSCLTHNPAPERNCPAWQVRG